MQYDIIGDVHGAAHKLIALLTRLGYRNSPMVGWCHPERKAVFVGDLVDRGAGQLEVVDIVRRMVEHGSAFAVMGNHELNAMAYYSAHPERPGDHLRTRSGSTGAKNRDQHRAFLAAVGEDSALHFEIIEWFTTLPLWLELPGADGSPGIRVAHACWDPKAMRDLGAWLAPGNTLSLEHMHDATTPGHWACKAVESITKGPEFRLPAGHSYRDAHGGKRTKTRLRWWDLEATTVRDLAALPAATTEGFPDEPLLNVYRPENDLAAPTFFGHYWMTGSPAPVARTMACVDYSAGTNGDLVAYRWSGEIDLVAANFVSSGLASATQPPQPALAYPG